jgi:hypothetical protein
MNEKPRRRWFRFSLSTFLVVVTLVCLVVGLEYRKIHERREGRKLVEELGGVMYSPTGGDVEGRAKINWLRGLLGDEPVGAIAFRETANLSEADKLRITDTFPGAYLMLGPGLVYENGGVTAKGP